MKTAYTEMVALLKREGFSKESIGRLNKINIEANIKYPLTPFSICRILEEYQFTRGFGNNNMFEQLFSKYHKIYNRLKKLYITPKKLKYINDR